MAQPERFETLALGGAEMAACSCPGQAVWRALEGVFHIRTDSSVTSAKTTASKGALAVVAGKVQCS